MTPTGQRMAPNPLIILQNAFYFMFPVWVLFLSFRFVVGEPTLLDYCSIVTFSFLISCIYKKTKKKKKKKKLGSICLGVSREVPYILANHIYVIQLKGRLLMLLCFLHNFGVHVQEKT